MSVTHAFYAAVISIDLLLVSSAKRLSLRLELFTLQEVQRCIMNLSISRIEYRTQEMPDVRPYVQGKDKDVIVVPLTDEILKLKRLYEEVIVVHSS